MPSRADAPAPAPFHAGSRLGRLFERLRPDRRGAWIVAFVLLGLIARGVRYGLCFPLWEDECFLCVNLLGAGFEGTASFTSLTGPLQYRQMAPPLFLFAQLAAVKALGFNEWALRLGPFLCSIAGLLLFARLACRLLPGRAATLAVGLFAVAYPGVRYAAEAKQYASDALVALLLLSLAVHWRQTGRTRWLWATAAFAPIAIGASYPAAFVLGGVSLAVLAELWNRRGEGLIGLKSPATGAWVAFNLATAGAFLALLLTAAKAQAGSDLNFMQTYWGHTFPPLTDPLALPGWWLEAHTSELFAWPVGGARGASVLTALLVVGGLPWAFRGGRTGLVAEPAGAAETRGRGWFLPVLLLGPFVVHFAAAALHRYPYGGHVKFAMHLGPAICLLAGAGGSWWSARCAGWIRRRPTWEPRVATALLCGVAAIGLTTAARDLANGAKNPADERQRSFARWFFHDAALEGPVKLVIGDEDGPFSEPTWTELSWSAMFLCNRAIQQPLTAADLGPLAPPAGTFRCVIYRDGSQPFDDAARDRWLSGMTERHRLAARDRFPLTRHDRRGNWIITDWVESYRFAPKAAPLRTAADHETLWARQ